MGTSADKQKDRDETILVLVATGAFVFHFLVARAYPSLTWLDEIFQTLEQGHRLAFGYGVVPWEFREGTRSWVLPALFGGVMKISAFLGPGSRGYLLGVRLFLSLLSIAPVVVAMQWARREKLTHWWVAGLATAIWFELVFFSAKALSEVFAAFAVVVGLFFCVAARDEQNPLKRAALWAGLAWGLAIGFRFHLLPAAAVALIWTGRKDLAKWKPLALGFGGVVLAFGLLDAVTWSYPFQSILKNFWVNVFEGKAAKFGVSPPWEYLRSFGAVWSWGALPLLVLAGLSARRWPVLGWVALAILLSHSAIAHKEYRFLAPLITVVVVAASLELARAVQERGSLGVAACALFALASFDGARRFDYSELPPRFKPGAFDSVWTVRAGELAAFDRLSTTANLCGVGVVGWGDTGGYTVLHRDVPIYNVDSRERLASVKPHLNYLVTLGENIGADEGFEREICWPSGMCLFSRDAGCEPDPSYTLNGYLADSGQ